jgi:ribonuclease P protein component
MSLPNSRFTTLTLSAVNFPSRSLPRAQHMRLELRMAKGQVPRSHERNMLARFKHSVDRHQTDLEEGRALLTQKAVCST